MIVVDTHIFLWFVEDNAKLDNSLQKRLEAHPEKVLLPSICLWEAMLLAQRGRIRPNVDDWEAALRKYVQVTGFVEVQLSHQIALLSRTLDFHHEDPADRFIAATAFAYDAELATVDERLRQLKWIKLAH